MLVDIAHFSYNENLNRHKFANGIIWSMPYEYGNYFPLKAGKSKFKEINTRLEDELENCVE